jgi:hypothetical protein
MILTPEQKFKDVLRSILGKDVVDAMLNARLSLPTIASHAAHEMFMRGTCSTEHAEIIRKELHFLEMNSRFSWYK